MLKLYTTIILIFVLIGRGVKFYAPTKAYLLIQ